MAILQATACQTRASRSRPALRGIRRPSSWRAAKARPEAHGTNSDESTSCSDDSRRTRTRSRATDAHTSTPRQMTHWTAPNDVKRTIRTDVPHAVPALLEPELPAPDPSASDWRASDRSASSDLHASSDPRAACARLACYCATRRRPALDGCLRHRNASKPAR
eukprot:1360877-Prymnesium_polylepis.1